MSEILLNMICIGGTAYLFGFAFLRLIGYPQKNQKNGTSQVMPEIDLSVVMGMCALTVFAQIFSFVSKVSTLAFSVVIVIVALILYCFRKNIMLAWKKYTDQKIESIGVIVILIFVGAVTVVLANQPTAHYDTDLYHAQSIRWIEEYGIVPGLGNLHNRLAYNSSFFALQALFSWNFLLGHSLHAVNAFVYFFFLSYAICSAKVFKNKKYFVSDFLRIALVSYMNYGFTVSSPETDHLALGLALYILIKWVEIWEENTGGGYEEKYTILSLIALFAISVKLSVGMIILLAIYPAIQLILMRKWKTIAKYVCVGFIIIIPFLIRNIVISGYLLYPYSKIDLFHFDWKMLAYALDFDRYEIRAWGQGLNDVNRFNAGFNEWFSTWKLQLGRPLRLLLYLNVPCIIIAVFIGIWRIIKKKDINFIIIISAIVASLMLWFTGSPLLRYGMCYIIILPLFLLGYGMHFLKGDINKFAVIVVIGIASYQLHPIVSTAANIQSPLQYNADYNTFACEVMPLNGIDIYYPVTGDQVGYGNFPSTPYIERLEFIQMRGDSIKSGFRIKEEFKNEFISTYGTIAKINMFEIEYQDKDNIVRTESDIINYLSDINDARYTMFISVKDDASNALTEEIVSAMCKLGLNMDLTGKFRSSYYAVISNGRVIEDMGAVKLEASGIIDNNGLTYSIVSAGYDCGNVSSIIINGKEYSRNSRGLNIVVYNNETSQIIDSVCFDTCNDLNASR